MNETQRNKIKEKLDELRHKILELVNDTETIIQEIEEETLETEDYL